MTDIETQLATYAHIIEEEAARLIETVPSALERQWTTSPVPRPREEDSRGSVGDSHSDPTADVATDPRRLAVRESVLRSREALREAAVALRAVRLAMERNLARYDGDV